MQGTIAFEEDWSNMVSIPPLAAADAAEAQAWSADALDIVAYGFADDARDAVREWLFALAQAREDEFPLLWALRHPTEELITLLQCTPIDNPVTAEDEDALRELVQNPAATVAPVELGGFGDGIRIVHRIDEEEAPHATCQWVFSRESGAFLFELGAVPQQALGPFMTGAEALLATAEIEVGANGHPFAEERATVGLPHQLYGEGWDDTIE